jgi:hypothetical protein
MQVYDLVINPIGDTPVFSNPTHGFAIAFSNVGEQSSAVSGEIYTLYLHKGSGFGVVNKPVDGSSTAPTVAFDFGDDSPDGDGYGYGLGFFGGYGSGDSFGSGVGYGNLNVYGTLGPDGDGTSRHLEYLEDVVVLYSDD